METIQYQGETFQKLEGTAFESAKPSDYGDGTHIAVEIGKTMYGIDLRDGGDGDYSKSMIYNFWSGNVLVRIPKSISRFLARK